MSTDKKAALALEDGSFFEGLSFGAEGERTGELVFNTSMAGYQEILSDPSYRGQMVLFTYPLIGNYGTNASDSESAGIYSEAVVVKEYSRRPSGARCGRPLAELLAKHGIPGIEGVDTRAITLKIREKGSLKAAVSTECLAPRKLVERARRAPDITGRDLAGSVSCRSEYVFSRGSGPDIAVLDCGVKLSTLRELAERRCSVKVYPAGTAAARILGARPDGVLISNGPGDPEGAPYLVETAKAIAGKIPLFGICFGHQIISLALGGRTTRLKFGHHGGNHPVQDLGSGRVLITSQNHNYNAVEETLPEEARPAYRNLYDGTMEGLRHHGKKIFSVQFHPEAGPGPNDAKGIFDEFIRMAGEKCLGGKT